MNLSNLRETVYFTSVVESTVNKKEEMCCQDLATKKRSRITAVLKPEDTEAMESFFLGNLGDKFGLFACI